MDDGLLLLSVEGLGDSPFVATSGEIWELLQGEKEGVCRDLIAEAPLSDKIAEATSGNLLDISSDDADRLQLQIEKE